MIDSNKDVDVARTQPDAYRPTIVALFFAQHSHIKNVQLVTVVVGRVLWFLLLSATLFSKEFEKFQIFGLVVIAFALWATQFYTSRKARLEEEMIRNSLVQLDEELEDFYIKSIHERQSLEYKYRRYRGGSSMSIFSSLTSNFELFVWGYAFVAIMVFRYLLNS